MSRMSAALHIVVRGKRIDAALLGQIHGTVDVKIRAEVEDVMQTVDVVAVQMGDEDGTQTVWRKSHVDHAVKHGRTCVKEVQSARRILDQEALLTASGRRRTVTGAEVVEFHGSGVLSWK